MKAKLPTTRAKTAYGLLSAITKLIVAEPKRYSQHTFIESEVAPTPEVQHFPACGTVGCVAGWVVVLRGPDGSRTPYSKVEHVAIDILGLDYDQSGVTLRRERAFRPTRARAGTADSRTRASWRPVTFALSKRPTRLSYSPRRCRP